MDRHVRAVITLALRFLVGGPLNEARTMQCRGGSDGVSLPFFDSEDINLLDLSVRTSG